MDWLMRTAIKSKLVIARLSQPLKQITILSSSYPTAYLSAAPYLKEAKADDTKEKQVQQWQAIQQRLLTIKKNIEGLMKGVESAVNTDGPAASAEATAAQVEA